VPGKRIFRKLEAGELSDTGHMSFCLMSTNIGCQEGAEAAKLRVWERAVTSIGVRNDNRVMWIAPADLVLGDFRRATHLQRFEHSSTCLGVGRPWPCTEL
jgi:hypothetical protein